MKICDEEGCSRQVVAKGLCSLHYSRASANMIRNTSCFGKCFVDGCDGDAIDKTNHLCRKHWLRKQRHCDPLAGGAYREKNRMCSVAGCGRPATGLGFCSLHYKRFKKFGDPFYVRPLKKDQPCCVEGCMNLVGDKGSHGMCRKHARRLWGKNTGYERRKREERENRRKITRYGQAISHPLYNTWSSMKDRCRNKNNKAYKNYGGRGIKVCDRWVGRQGFWNFVDDMGNRPKGYSLDRIDSNGDYEPSNCRWATRHLQNINKRVQRENHNIKADTRHGHTLYVVQIEKANDSGGKDIITRKSFNNIEAAIRYRDRKEVDLCLL